MNESHANKIKGDTTTCSLENNFTKRFSDSGRWYFRKRF